MDRCALFVDANYALGEGALAVHGTRNRDSVSWDYAGLLKLLGSLSTERTGLPLLRCYWYDVATAGSRAAEHDVLADLPGVKVRLSKARPSRKEGLEAEIRKDLAALARNRAVSDVIIVSAEEDLAPVIAEVQDLGIRAVLLGVGMERASPGARSLRQECDDSIEVSPGHLRPYVDLIAGAEPELGYRGIPEGAGHARGAQAAIEAPVPVLYAAPVAAGYERAPQLATLAGPGPDRRDQLPAAAQYQHTDQVTLARAGETGYAAGVPGAVSRVSEPAFATPDESVRAPSGQNGGAHRGLPEDAHRGLPDDGRPGGVLPGTQTGAQAGGHAATGMSPAGFGTPTMHQNGLAPAGMPPNGMTASQGNGMPGLMSGPATGFAGAGVPTANGLPASQGLSAPGGPNGLPPSGAPGGAQSPPPGQQDGFPALGQSPGQPPAAHQSLQQGLPQPVPGQQIAPRPIGGPAGPQPQNGLHSLDSQGQHLQQRQLPAGNGMPYGQDRGMPYSNQAQPPQTQPPQAQPAHMQAPQIHPHMQPPQMQPPQAQPHMPPGYAGGPAGQPGYPAGPYGMQQPAAPEPLALSVGDAAASAHAEGFGFGEAVARDAPALWLEAVLARKPRMPSDLEARLLQGSALPIDSLLHDEVRHALRRGFWDALERSRH